MAATVAVALQRVSNRTEGAIMPVVSADPDQVAYLDDVSVSAAAGITVPADGQQYYWRIDVAGGSVWYQVGASPTASEGNDHGTRIPTGTTFFSADAGHDIAFLDAG